MSTIKRKMFDLGSGFYDVFTDQSVWWNHCKKLIPPGESPATILDVGCGPGISAFSIEEELPDSRIFGLDVSFPMIKKAMSHKRTKESCVDFIRGDANQLPFPDKYFELVTGHSFLYLLDHRNKVLNDIHRVLTKGGHITFLEPRQSPGLRWIPRVIKGGPRFATTMVAWQVASAYSGRFSKKSLKKLLASCGFNSIELEVTLGGLGLLVRGIK